MTKSIFEMMVISEGIYQEKPVVLKSGEESRYFYDFRKVNNAGSFRVIARALNQVITHNPLFADTTCFFTSAYGGIGITLALLMHYRVNTSPYSSIKMGYARKERKEHGEESKVIGYFPRIVDNVVLIDDVLTTGSSITEMSNFLCDTGCRVLGAVVLLNRANDKVVEGVKRIINAPLFWITTHDEIQKKLDELRLNDRSWIFH